MQNAWIAANTATVREAIAPNVQNAWIAASTVTAREAIVRSVMIAMTAVPMGIAVRVAAVRRTENGVIVRTARRTVRSARCERYGALKDYAEHTDIIARIAPIVRSAGRIRDRRPRGRRPAESERLPETLS